MSKDDLIDHLENCVSEADFPIKLKMKEPI
jgi:hypothetical protein